MASLASVEREINGLPSDQRAIFLRIFRPVLKEMRLGHPTGDNPDPCENFGGGFYHIVTPATPGDELAVAHGFGRAPYLLIPVLPLDVVNAEIVPVQVSRAADARYIYLKSTEGSAAMSIYVEG